MDSRNTKYCPIPDGNVAGPYVNECRYMHMLVSCSLGAAVFINKCIMAGTNPSSTRCKLISTSNAQTSPGNRVALSHSFQRTPSSIVFSLKTFHRSMWALDLISNVQDQLPSRTPFTHMHAACSWLTNRLWLACHTLMTSRARGWAPGQKAFMWAC